MPPLVAAVLVAAGATGATHAADPLRAVGVQVAVPGDAPVQAAAGTAFEPSFAYPDDGSAVRTGVIVTSIEGSASAEVSDVSLFGGAVRASLAAARADGPELRDLVVGGRPITPTDGQRVQLDDWGVATLLDDTAGSVTAIDVRLTSHHAGLPAGTEITVAHVDVPLPDTTSTVGILTPAPEPEIVPAPTPRLPARPPEPRGPVTVRRPPPGIHPRLTAGHYVFPVYGEVAVGDTFGAARADVGYHHGDDLFAPAGTPVLAVADGRVYSVGWNRLGGNRLWLQDGQGNQFYYAHLSAFAPAARNRASVRAGTVLGFVGNSGDADGTPYHLHFEVHPVSLLYLGEDGAVDPTPYLVAWQRLRDISLTPAQGWVPPAQTSTPAPLPGAVLVASTDISTASGLVPGALQRAINRALPGDRGAPPAARPTASRPAPSTTPPRRAGRG